MHEICRKCPKLMNCMISADHCHRYNWIFDEIKVDVKVYHAEYDIWRHINADMDGDSE